MIPAYWLALTVLAIYPGLGLTVGNAWVYFGFLHIYSKSTSYGGLDVSWSLCAEATFYLLLPVYSLLVARLTRRVGKVRGVRRELSVLGALSAFALLLQVYITDGGHTASLFFLTRMLLCASTGLPLGWPSPWRTQSARRRFVGRFDIRDGCRYLAVSGGPHRRRCGWRVSRSRADIRTSHCGISCTVLPPSASWCRPCSSVPA